MRNHSHCRRNSAARVGGLATPMPGRMPRGAKKSDRNAASSSMPSDWYDEKSCAAVTNDRNAMPAIAIDNRGQTLNVIASDAARPAHTRIESAVSDALIHKSDGTNQNARQPTALRAS